MMQVDGLMNAVVWRAVPRSPQPSGEPSDLPYATHEGELEIMGHRLRVFQLNTGVRVFDADDVAAFFDALDGRA